MPSHDPPDVFGLYPLADVKLRYDQANEIFKKSSTFRLKNQLLAEKNSSNQQSAWRLTELQMSTGR